MKKINGGRAHINGVSIYSEDKMARVTYKKDEGYKIYSAHLQKSDDKKILTKLSKIPFIRAFIFLINMIRQNRRIFYAASVFYIILIVGLSFLGEESIVAVDNAVNLLYESFLVEILFALIFLIIFRMLPISNYHGAEHKVINAYMANEDGNITMQDIRSAARDSNACGSALVLNVISVRILLFWLPIDGFFITLIAYSIGYEIFRRKSKYLTPVFKFSSMIQNLFLTAKPNDHQLYAAIIAIEKATNIAIINKSHPF
jgi:uncharacterized protein YqhQ